MKNDTPKFQIGDRVVVIVLGKFYAKIRNVRFDNCGEVIYDLIGENGDDYVAREFEIKLRNIDDEYVASEFDSADYRALMEEETAQDRKFEKDLGEKGFV